MRCIHYEVCTGKQTSIGNGSSVVVYGAFSALAVVLVLSQSADILIMTDHLGLVILKYCEISSINVDLGLYLVLLEVIRLLVSLIIIIVSTQFEPILNFFRLPI